MLTEGARLGDVNVRATPDTTFWGRSFENSIYLWPWAKHRLTVKEMAAAEVPTLDDAVATPEQIQNAHDHCRETFYKYLPILAEQLNARHNLDLPVVFWRTVFGYWLFRHICIVYDKFCGLRRLDIDRTDVRTLSRRSFYVPKDHFDHVFYYGDDHGVMQLVSEYYQLFGAKSFASIDATWSGLDGWNPEAHLVVRKRQVSTLRQALKQLRGYVRSGVPGAIRRLRRYMDATASGRGTASPVGRPIQRIGLTNVHYTPAVRHELAEKSGGAIAALQLPAVATADKALDAAWRASLPALRADSPFERYLVTTLECAFPRILVEHFRDYYDAFARDVARRQLSHIVTETWQSFMPLSIYCAVARQHKGVKLVLQQHGASLQWHLCCLDWLATEVADTFLTTGWTKPGSNVVAGGFAIRPSVPYRFDSSKTEILHVGTTMFYYPYEFGDGSTGFTNYLAHTDALIDAIPPRLRPHYVLRPRRSARLWDTEAAWDVQRRQIKLDSEPEMSKSVQRARVVVVDHLSTAIGEILVNRVPFLLMHYEDFEPLADEYGNLFDELTRCGVVHGTVESAVKHLDAIYDDVEGWWTAPAVRKPVDEIAERFLAPASRTVESLLALLTPEARRQQPAIETARKAWAG